MEKQELHLDSNVKKTSVSTPKKLDCPAMISGSAFGTFGQSRQFGADLPRSQTISITGGFATLASAPASEGGFAAVATGSGGGGFDGVLSGGAPALGGELGVSSLDETEEPSAEVDLGKVTKKKKRATQNITPVKKPTKDGQPKKKLGKKSGIIVKIAKEYVPYSGQMVSMRTATSHFITMISRLNEDQRKIVEKIGFGPLLSLEVTKIPTGLGYWLITNYHPDENTLNVGSRKINVTALEGREIFGLPMGEKEVIEREKPRDRDEVVAEFNFQFPPESADRVLLVELTNFMKSQKDAGWMFTINFMVVFATIFGNTMKNSTVNKRFLNNIRQDADIKNYNWCEYLIKCLKRERRDCNGFHFVDHCNFLRLVMAFDKVDNELNSKKEKVKKAQSEIKPGKLTSSLSLSASKKFLKNLSLNDGADENKNMAKDSDEGKQKETSAQYDITPRMMLEFEKSEKTKDVRNEDISDDITPSLVMAFDKVDNEVNSKKDSKVVANEPVLSFGFSMIASPDKQDYFDKDLNSKKEKVESPHTETKQGENAEVSEKDDDFMMAKGNFLFDN
ncbi:hypothetical protein SSX86_007651 [Deinandra increscens subsp. villosa]|uniref:Uncharacterized protein n=1 Tax=Deinandra increscens subsp. villosa TaxID=3103831 RepID=A0AAP0DIG4_9ASTR